MQFSNTIPDITGTLIGWGLDQTDGEIQTILQRVDLRVYSTAECAAIHSGRTYPSNICAGVYGGGKGQCSVSISNVIIIM